MGVADLLENDILHVQDNRTAAAFFGTTPESMRGKSARELGAPPESVAEWMSHYRRAQQTKQPVTFEYSHLQPNATPRTLSATVNFIEMNESGLPRFSYTVTDVTEARQTLSRLKASEERLSLALIGTNDGIWDWNLATGDLYVSPRWLQMLGYAEGEFIPSITAWTELVHPDDLPTAQAQLKAHIDGAALKYELEHRLKRKDGTWLWILGRAKITERSPDGRAMRMVGANTDIDHQKRIERSLRESEQKVRDLMQFAPVGIFSSWPSGEQFFVNDCWKEITGLSQEDSMGLRWERCLHEDDREWVKEAWTQTVLRAEEKEVEFRIRRPSGEVRWVFCRVVPLRDSSGKLVQFLGSTQDITELRIAQIESARAKDEALRSASAKAEFLANMSHEIRTPMNGIIGMCDLLLGTAQDPEQVERLRIIQSCGGTLLTLINDILDFSRIEAGKIQLGEEPFDLTAAAGEVRDLFKSIAAHKGLKLSLKLEDSCPSWISGDENRFRQILTNLVSNAIKFTEEGSVSITAMARIRGEHGFEIQFSVTDTGVGIPSGKIPELFKSFSQVDASTTRRFGGSGLGLAISKGLSEQMGGTLTLASKVGIGSTFTFTFKAQSAEAKDSARIVAVANPRTKESARFPMRILVAEDNPTNQLVLRGLLERLGYESDLASNGAQVMAALNDRNYDLILMDCHMPGMDGFETTRLIRQTLGAKSPRIVAVTASAMPDEIARCLSSGMSEVVTKPFSSEELVRVMENAAKKDQAETLPAATDQSLVFDRAHFEKRFADHFDLADSVVQTFLDSIESMTLELKSAVESGDVERVKLAAHTLKGAATNLSAQSLSKVASRIERMCSEGTVSSRIILDSDEVFQSAERTKVALATYRNERMHS